MLYLTLGAVYHSKENRIIGPGQEIDLGHLPPEFVEMLVQTRQVIALTSFEELGALPGIGKEAAMALVYATGVQTPEQFRALDPLRVAHALGISRAEAEALQKTEEPKAKPNRSRPTSADEV